MELNLLAVVVNLWLAPYYDDDRSHDHNCVGINSTVVVVFCVLYFDLRPDTCSSVCLFITNLIHVFHQHQTR